MDAQAWVGIGAICASTIGYIVIVSFRTGNKIAVLEKANMDLEHKLEEQKRDFDKRLEENKRDSEKQSEETNKKVTEFKNNLQIHESLNEKTFANIDRKLDDITKNLSEISGYLKGKNQQSL